MKLVDARRSGIRRIRRRCHQRNTEGGAKRRWRAHNRREDSGQRQTLAGTLRLDQTPNEWLCGVYSRSDGVTTKTTAAAAYAAAAAAAAAEATSTRWRPLTSSWADEKSWNGRRQNVPGTQLKIVVPRIANHYRSSYVIYGAAQLPPPRRTLLSAMPYLHRVANNIMGGRDWKCPMTEKI